MQTLLKALWKPTLQISIVIGFFLSLCLSPSALAQRQGGRPPAAAMGGTVSGHSLMGGLSWVSYNTYSTTSSLTGKKDLLGVSYYPLSLRLFIPLKGPNWQLSPRFSYSILPRQMLDGAGESRLMSFTLPVNRRIGGRGFGRAADSSWDWWTGPGLLQDRFKGSGGAVVLNDGAGMQVFHRPAGDRTAQMLLWHLGSGWTKGPWRIDMELAFNWPLSEKQTQHLMLTASYRLWSGP